MTFPLFSPFRSLSNFGRSLLFAAALVGCPALSVADDAKSPTQAEQLAEVERLEKAELWDDALQLAETIYETTPTDDATRQLLRGKFDVLRQKVAPNRDPAKAGVWKVRAFVVRSLDFTWQEGNATRRAQYVYDDEEVERIRRGMAGFAAFVEKYSDGWLRIEWTFEVVEKTATAMDDINGRYWPGAAEIIPLLPEIPVNSTDTIMTFVKTGGTAPADVQNDAIPLLLFGGAIGEWAPVTRGATYISFNWGTGAASHEPDGEPMLHEWLHSLQWALEDRQGYPRNLGGDPDGGRFVGEERALEDADPCYRRDPKKEKSWIGLYEHILRCHNTRNMLREAASRDKKVKIESAATANN
ncbi:MAG: hypothetical protein IKY61_03500 [Thermoguttaceae bacterium]|nr:hypothetical protein [Thermoguttaceae bacterium]